MNFRDVDRTSTARAADARRLMDALRRCLPLMANPRGRSLTASIAGARRRDSDRRCRVANVFDAGDGFGLMCQIEVGDAAASAIFVTPIAELAFDRRHPIARAVADYRRRRAQTRIADFAQRTPRPSPGNENSTRDLQPGHGIRNFMSNRSAAENVRDIQRKRTYGRPRRPSPYGALRPQQMNCNDQAVHHDRTVACWDSGSHF